MWGGFAMLAVAENAAKASSKGTRRGVQAVFMMRWIIGGGVGVTK
jgi:hypothetical protein